MGLTAEPKDAEHHLWLVDPQDGTSAAEKGFRGAAVSIALLRNGLPVLGVVLAYAAPDSKGDLFFWAEGMRAVHRNGAAVARTWTTEHLNGGFALISQHADNAAEINAKILHPLRYRTVTGIAYRLALLAAGEGDLAVSLNGPTGWDIAGGHALLLGAGGDVFDETAARVTYDRSGDSTRPLEICFGGHAGVVSSYAKRKWHQVFSGKASSYRASSSLSFLSQGKVITDAALLSRAQGCLLGQLAGDALGSLVEFESASQIAANYADGPTELADGGCWSTLAGQPTDDSELALALARSLVTEKRFDGGEVASAYARWLDSRPFDVGTTTRQALDAARYALERGGNVAEAAMAAASQTSQANGALMRISPLAIFAHAKPEEEVMKLARADAALTHPNPVCQDANAVFAASVAFAIRSGADGRSVYDFALQLTSKYDIAQPIVERLAAAATHAPKFGENIGWVLIAFQNAFYQLLHGGSLREGLIATVRGGGDTDTNAAIAGALLGAVYGRGEIPRQWADQLSCCRPIVDLPEVKRPRPAVYWPVDALSLAENLLLASPVAAQSQR